MMRFLMIAGLIAGALASGACAMMQKPAAAPESAQPVVEIAPDEKAFQAAQELLDSKKSIEAEQAFRNFQQRYPQSRFVMLSRMGVARALEDQDKWTEAAENYRTIQKLSATYQPEIAAHALYRLSYCYEALGEDDRAVATLLDANRRRKLLPEEVALAEIPARLAMFYEKAQNKPEAEKYVEQAQKGISMLQGKPELSKQILAKAYYQMGTVSLNQISSSNYSSTLRALKAVQVYPIRSIGLNQAPWSEASLSLLKKDYRDLWNTLLEMPGVSGVDDVSIERTRRELQASLGGEFLDLIQQAELNGPLDPEKNANSLQRELYKYLNDIKLKVQDLIYRSEPQMGLTSESQRLNSLKRKGRIRADELLPEEKKSGGLKKKKGSPVIDSDPNL